jgi:D-3-phosphoglycerate dehydrogenase
VVSTTDLLWGIKNGRVAGAGIDVFEDEPLHKGSANKWDVYYDLITYPEVVATPHIAGWSRQSKVLLASVLADKIGNWWLMMGEKLG